MADVIVVNEEDEIVGTMPKEEAHQTGAPHRIAIVYVEDGKGKFLVQVRMNGVLDHSAAGHVIPGEAYLEAAKRELQEELGIEGVELTKIGHGTTHNEGADDGQVRSHVFDIFVCTAQPGKLQDDEVKDAYWADPRSVFEDMPRKRDKVKYAGAFLVSLPIYAQYKQTQAA